MALDLWRKGQTNFRTLGVASLDEQRASQPRGAFAHDAQPIVAFRLAQAGDAAAVVNNADGIITARGDLATDSYLPCIGMFDGVDHRFPHNLQRMYLLLGIERLGGKPTV